MNTTLTQDVPTTTPVIDVGSTALTTITPKEHPDLRVVLSTAQQAKSDAFSKLTVLKMTGQDIVLFGSDRQKALSTALDTLLDGVTKGSSPLLFELFSRLKKGVDNINVVELETQIKNSLGKSFFTRVLDKVGLDSVAKRASRVNDQISSMITSKSKSLRDLMSAMEGQSQAEIQRLIGELTRLGALDNEYKTNVGEFAIYVDAGRKILTDGRKTETALIATAQQSRDPIQIQELKAYQRNLELFENRVLILENAYVKAPGQLESLGLIEGSTMTTLSETANSILEEFNDIKSSLISLSVMYKLQSVQQLNSERRKLREVLQKHSLKVLEDVSVQAAQVQGDNRLEDAMLLSSFATGIKTISEKVQAKLIENHTKYENARTQLIAAQNTFSEIKQLT